MNRLKFTLKAWPVIAVATIGLCYLTQAVAGWLGINLPDQEQLTLVRTYLAHAFDSPKMFLTVVCLLAQVLLLAPALEEVLFRWAGWQLPARLIFRSKAAGAWALAVVSSAAFSAAHYIDYVALARGGGFKWLPPSSAFLALFLFGLAQCWLYRKTERLWCPMLNHFLFNLTNLALLAVLPQQ